MGCLLCIWYALHMGAFGCATVASCAALSRRPVGKTYECTAPITGQVAVFWGDGEGGAPN